MEIFGVFIALMVSLILREQNPSFALNFNGNDLKQQAGLREGTKHRGLGTKAPALKCELQGTARLPVFSEDGDYVIGGVFSIHHYKQTVKHNYTAMPEPVRCTGRLVKMEFNCVATFRSCYERCVLLTAECFCFSTIKTK